MQKWPFLLIALMLAVTVQASEIEIHVFTALAPNAYGSPSFGQWQSNAVAAMANGATSYGDPTKPTYFQVGSSYNSDQVVVTGFNSWLGKADPGSVYGSAYASELGNRMTFPLLILGNGNRFSISQLSFVGTSSDFWDGLGFSYAGGYTYSAGYVGLNYGADGIKGTADDFLVTGGADTQLVDELWGRGSGNSYPAYCAGCSIADQQQAILDIAAYAPYDFTGTYSLAGVSGSATFHITTPEPGTLGMLGAGLLALTAVFRRKRQTGRK
jgi:hypothetical protein